MCRPGKAGAPSLPLSCSPGEVGLPSASIPDVSLLELELLLELLLAAAGFTAFGSVASGLSASPGNGNFLAAGVAGAEGASGAPLKFGDPMPGLGDALSPGNGNFCAASGLLAGFGVVPHGSGCGATEHGAGLASGLLCATHGNTAHAAPISTHPRSLRIANSLHPILDASRASASAPLTFRASSAHVCYSAH